MFLTKANVEKKEEAPRKCTEILSMGKVLATVFRDCWGILLIECIPRDINPDTGKKYTIDQQWYFDTILHLRDTNKSKQPSLSLKKVMLIHYNARLHTAKLIASLKWDTFPHPAYSPDLTSSNFWVLLGSKESLGGISLPLWTFWGSFSIRIISKNLWLPRSPHLSPCDFFLGYVKDQVFAHNPTFVEELKVKITDHRGHSLRWCSDAAKSIPEPAEVSSGVLGNWGRAYQTSLLTFCSNLTYKGRPKK